MKVQTKIIILVTDRDDDRHGEISVVEDPEKAARLLESIIEAGLEQERIRVFTGSELAMQVTLRPVVALADVEAAAEDTTEAWSEREEEERSDIDEIDVDDADHSSRSAFRFSSLFRSD